MPNKASSAEFLYEAILELQREVRVLKKRLSDLERNSDDLIGPGRSTPHFPSDPPRPIPWSPPPEPGLPDPAFEPRCGKCGIEFKNMTHYVCPRYDCPSRTTIL